MTGVITNDLFLQRMTELKDLIKAEAEKLGFCLCGFTTADPSEDYARYTRWLAEESLGTMSYLKREDTLAKRADPHLLLQDAESICVLAVPMGLFPQKPAFSVASYAHYIDYHDAIHSMAEELIRSVRLRTEEEFSCRICVDSAPILERSLAVRAGLGWIGKSSMLVNERWGSAIFLCEILLSLSLEPDAPFAHDRCGNCERCVKACPNGCIDPVSRTIQADRCAAYLTIEHKGEFDHEQSGLVGEKLFGCDECLRACPWNRNNTGTSPIPLCDMIPDENDELLTESEFKAKFQNSPVLRTKAKGLKRNIEAVRRNMNQQGNDSPPHQGKIEC